MTEARPLEARILLIVLGRKRDRQLLKSFLGRRFHAVVAQTDAELSPDYDLIVVDAQALKRTAKTLLALKRVAQPVFLPVLAVSSRREVSALKRHLGGAVDELLVAPVNRVELQARVSGLLRARRWSAAGRRFGAAPIARSEERYRTIIDIAEEGVWIIDTENRTAFVNDKIARMLGYSAAEMLGRSLFEFMDEDARAVAEDNLKRRRRGIREQHEFRFRRRDGKDMWALLSTGPLLNKRGDYEGAVAMITDITDRKRAEQALRESESRFRHLVEATHEGVFLHEGGTILDVNEAGARMFGYDVHELVGKSIFDLTHPDSVEMIREKIRTGAEGSYEAMGLRKDGSVFPGELHVRNIAYQGRPVRAVAIRDLAERKRTEELLRRYERIVASTPDHMSVLDRDYKYLLVNRAYELAHRRSRDVIVGQTVANLLGQEVFDKAVKPKFDRCLQGEVVNYQDWFEFAAGGRRYMNVTYYPYRGAGGEITGVVVSSRDTTDLRQAELALQESESRMRHALHAANAGAWEWDIRSNRAVWSDENYRVMGLEPGSCVASYEHWLDRVYPDDRAATAGRVAAAVAKRSELDIEFRVQWPDGSIHWIRRVGRTVFDENGEPRGMYGIQIDITESKLAEQRLRESQERYQRIFESAPVPIWEEDFSGVKAELGRLQDNGVTDIRDYLRAHPEFVTQAARSTVVLDVNSAAVRTFGAENKAELLGALDKVLTSESLDAFNEQLVAIAKGDPAITTEAVAKRLDGEKLDVVVSIAIPGVEATLSHLLVCTMDITDRKRAEEALHRNERFLQAIIDSEPQCVALVDRDGVIKQINASGLDIIEAGHPDQVIEKSVCPLVVPEYRPALRALSERVFSGVSDSFQFEVTGHKGSRRWVEAHVVPLRGDDGEVRYCLSITADITDQKHNEERLMYLAFYDGLTGLPNRFLFRDRLSQALAEASRHQGLLAVALLDLDRFKHINDTLGHEAGDELLKQVAGRLKEVLRSGDTTARQGGDEFTFALTDIQHVNDVFFILDKILACFDKPFSVRGHEHFLTASLGVTIYPFDDRDISALLRNADVAMYNAKSQGGNRYLMYTATMSETVTAQLEIENALRGALEREEFSLHYQPQTHLSSSTIVGAEALLRWHHPELGVVPPAVFIPLAEEIGLIGPIGDWVLRTACNQLAAWQRSKMELPRIAVNLSAYQLQSSGFMARLTRILQETAIDASQLDLELTESQLLEHVDANIAILKELMAMGVQVSVDDFGTGYSSLSYLKRFPVTTIKIDRTFVRGLPEDSDDSALATAIIAIGHSLQLQVVAEGVETKRQLEFLQSRGCDAFQGYYISRPLPADELVEFLLRQAG